MNVQPLPERLAKVEGRVEEHSRIVEDIAGRFTNMERRFDRLESHVDARFERVEARLDHLDVKIDQDRRELDSKMTLHFTWLAGLVAGSGLGLAYEMFHLARLTR